MHTVPYKSPRDVTQVNSSMHNRDSDQSWLIGIKTKLLSATVVYWLTVRHEQTIEYVIVQTKHRFHHHCITRTSSNNQKFWTANTQNLSTVQMYQPFSHNYKKLLLQSGSRKVYQVPLRIKSKPSRKKPEKLEMKCVTKAQHEFQFPFRRRITWKQRWEFVGSEKRTKLIKLTTPPVPNNLPR